jgi:hypothetical protein
VAGGWVRDKLLGLPSDDIDIALDDCSGVEFANLINDYMKAIGLPVRSIGVIQANPDQSKHLETANVRILQFSVDCVNLRAESYALDSRIPITRCGTPQDDAMRRDFTINALFYNVSEGKVEDFTCCGLADLKIGVISTPLDPFVTFRDDPLRVLRGIRFASRYNFKLAKELIDAASDPEIRNALLLKVSKERVWKELEGMLGLTGCSIARPALALTMIHNMSLFETIFHVESSLEKCSTVLKNARSSGNFSDVESCIASWKADVHTSEWCHMLMYLAGSYSGIMTEELEFAALSLNSTLTVPSEHEILMEYVYSSKTRCELKQSINIETLMNACCNANALIAPGVLLLSSFLFKLYAVEYLGKKSLPLSTFLLRDSLKVDNDLIKTVENMHYAASHFNIFSLKGCQREEVGMVLRTCKSHWRSAILVACASNFQSGILCNCSSYEFTEQDLSIIRRFVDLSEAIQAMQLEDSWNEKPLLGGNDLVSDCKIPRGPLIGKATEAQIRWRLRNPASSREDCREFILQWCESQQGENSK